MFVELSSLQYNAQRLRPHISIFLLGALLFIYWCEKAGVFFFISWKFVNQLLLLWWRKESLSTRNACIPEGTVPKKLKYYQINFKKKKLKYNFIPWKIRIMILPLWVGGRGHDWDLLILIDCTTVNFNESNPHMIKSTEYERCLILIGKKKKC